MSGIRHVRTGFLVLAALTALVVPAAAAGDHGSGGGGGTTTSTAAPAVTFSPTSLTFADQAIGTIDYRLAHIFRRAVRTPDEPPSRRS